MNITLLVYNNYFNRKLKRLETLGDYLDLRTANNSASYYNINFIPNDDVDTEQILNIDPLSNLLPNEFDYAIVYDEYSFSRWFITEAIRLRNGQYRLHFKRDVLSDNYDLIYDDPIFVERAWLKNNDPMIFNDEGMKFNQIKTGEKLLVSNPLRESSDRLRKYAWIIGYVQKKELSHSEITIAANPTPNALTMEQLSNETGISTTLLASILNFNGTASDKLYALTKDSEVHIFYTSKISNQHYSHDIYFNDKFQFKNALKDYSIAREIIYQGGLGATGQQSSPEDQFLFTNSVSISNIVKSINDDIEVISYDSLNKLKTLITNGLVVYYNFKNYQISEPIDQNHIRKDVSIGINTQSMLFVRNNIQSNPYFNDAVIDSNGHLKLYCDYDEMTIIANEVSTGSYKIPLANVSNRKSCAGSVCDIFAIPFGPAPIGWVNEDTHELEQQLLTISDKDLLFKFASSIATSLSAELYDIQLVPYCPIKQNARGYYDECLIDIENMTEGSDYDFIKLGNDAKSIIFWLTTNKHSEIIRLDEYVDNPKIDALTKFIRITSPNGQGYLDMVPAKNNGLIEIRVNSTLKPYSPTIQLLPIYSGLYGDDYNDYRGLVCGGDFSLPRVEEVWIQYQLNNKNYQNMFSRDIQSMDVKQGVSRTMDVLGGVAGIVGGTAGGASAGANYGGAAGAAAGTLIGGMVAGVTTGITLAGREQLRAEEKDYAIDKYNFTLGNVQAQPNTVTKIDSFIINSKIYPFVEFFDCSEAEKIALENKIKYQSMSVFRIGSISEFRSEENPHFFKGQYIMNSDNTIQSDTHTLNAIYEELLKGVYL